MGIQVFSVDITSTCSKGIYLKIIGRGLLEKMQRQLTAQIIHLVSSTMDKARKLCCNQHCLYK